jgi:hypothetical protein
MTSSITQTEAPDEGDGKLPVPVAECPNCGDTVKGLDEINTTCFECGLGFTGRWRLALGAIVPGVKAAEEMAI